MFILVLFFFIQSCYSSNESSIKVVKFQKENIPSDNISEYSDQCKTWVLDKSSIIEILETSDTITAHEKNYIFNTLSCEYKGEVLIKGKEYNFVINAGSYSVIYDNEHTYYLGFFKKKNFFLGKPDIEQVQN